MSREVISSLFKRVEPEEVVQCRRRGFRRRHFRAAGINDVWPQDQHDRWAVLVCGCTKLLNQRLRPLLVPIRVTSTSFGICSGARHADRHAVFTNQRKEIIHPSSQVTPLEFVVVPVSTAFSRRTATVTVQFPVGRVHHLLKKDSYGPVPVGHVHRLLKKDNYGPVSCWLCLPSSQDGQVP